MEQELVCAGCSKPINPKMDEYTIVGTSKKGIVEKVVCPQCRAKFQDELNQEALKPNIPLAVLAGLLGAVVAGIIWYYFVIITGWQFGLVSVLMGWLTGKSVIWGSGNKRGQSLQFISLALTVLAIIFSEYLIFNHYFVKEFGVGNLTIGDFFTVYRYYFTHDTGFLDILFFGIALWQAYKTPQMRELNGVTMNSPRL
jgi:hypothetical protein